MESAAERIGGLTNIAKVCYIGGNVKTLNISLTGELAKEVDQMVESYGFASRSELFRALLRFCTATHPPIHTFPFEEPPTQNAKEIIENFRNTGKYSPQFISSLTTGLKRSTFFKKK